MSWCRCITDSVFFFIKISIFSLSRSKISFSFKLLVTIKFFMPPNNIVVNSAQNLNKIYIYSLGSLSSSTYYPVLSPFRPYASFFTDLNIIKIFLKQKLYHYQGSFFLGYWKRGQFLIMFGKCWAKKSIS